MRKWMRDKLKGRKKSEADTSTKPAPLQPAYFGGEPEAAPPEAPASERGLAEPSPEPSESEPSDAAEATESSPMDITSQPGSQAGDNARRPRRRRGRGGRGRRRPGQAQSAAPASSGVQASTQLLAPTPTVAAPQAQRPSKGLVILAVGLPGSGKSSWFKRH